MKPLSLCEYQWVRPGPEDSRPDCISDGIQLPSGLFERLEAWDFSQAGGRDGQTVFHWQHKKARARQYVGVIQLGRHTIEILPKTAARGDQPLAGTDLERERGNLVEMLRTSGLVSLRDRGVAPQAVKNVPLFEALLLMFASALLAELRQGSPRSYIRREENLTRWKGKLNAAKQATRNLLHPERFFVNYSEFSPETPLTRILRAGVLLAKRYAVRSQTHRILDECAAWLGGLHDPVHTPDEFRISFTRQNDRFRSVHDFSLQLLRQQVNAPVSGGARIFSLLFDMNQVFEGYVTQLYREIAPKHRLQVIAQGTGQREHLVYADSHPRGKGRRPHLEPDILVRGGKKSLPVAVIDTKWKLVNHSSEATSDLYQLYAYAGQFGAPTNILLYPCHTPDSDTNHLLHRLGYVHPHTLLGGPSEQSIYSVRLNVARDLTDPDVRDAIRTDLCRLVFEREGQPSEECVMQ